MQSSPRVHAYVDETGDRGNSVSASPVFGMAAVLVDDQGEIELRHAIEQLRQDFSVPAGKVMSWKQNVKTHDRRKHAAKVLGSVSGLRVCYTYAEKDALQAGSYLEDRERFYNYVALKTYTSILWAARSWKGSNTQLWTRFGHVRHHDHTHTEAYLLRETAQKPSIPHQIEQGLRWVSADKYEESQAADLYAGFMKAATWPSGFGYVEPSYLLSVWHQIRNSGDCAIPLGFMPMPNYNVMAGHDWFPCTTCPKITAR